MLVGTHQHISDSLTPLYTPVAEGPSEADIPPRANSAAIMASGPIHKSPGTEPFSLFLFFH
jgi:hypothetical protein